MKMRVLEKIHNLTFRLLTGIMIRMIMISAAKNERGSQNVWIDVPADADIIC